MTDTVSPTVPLPQGKIITIINEVAQSAGVYSRRFSLDADSLLVTLFVQTLSAGTLDLKVYTGTDDNKELLLTSFPTITGSTATLLIKKAAIALSRIRVEVTLAGGIATYEVRARGISTGETSAKILSPGNWTATQKTVTTTPGVLITSTLVDRQGLIIKNWNTSGNLYLGESAGTAVIGNGFPLGPGESLAIDLDSGATLYAVGDTTIDVRIAQAGG